MGEGGGGGGVGGAGGGMGGTHATPQRYHQNDSRINTESFVHLDLFNTGFFPEKWLAWSVGTEIPGESGSVEWVGG